MKTTLRIDGKEIEVEEGDFCFYFLPAMAKKAEQEGITTKEYLRIAFTGMLMEARAANLQRICRESLASNQSGSFRAIKER